ncbi:MAG: hypothetical protein PHI12_08575 [Dehalococcoidales bacterium]|nr:hypothetical protein [Dehalococcoidales bacterium]
MPALTELDRGYKVTGPVVNLAVAGVGTAAVVFIRSNFAGQIGTKSFRIKKVICRNNAAGATFLNIGTGVGGLFVAAIPALMTLNNMDQEFGPEELGNAEFFASATAWPTALAAGGTLDVQIEVEEIG